MLLFATASTRSAYFRDDDCSEALLTVDEPTEIAG
jgi:hypothetical protein